MNNSQIDCSEGFVMLKEIWNEKYPAQGNINFGIIIITKKELLQIIFVKVLLVWHLKPHSTQKTEKLYDAIFLKIGAGANVFI